MNNHIKEIAVNAGFCPWGSEYWNPGDAIDWSSRYDSELENFASLMVDSCIEEIKKTLNKLYDSDSTRVEQTIELYNAISILKQYKASFTDETN